MQSLLTLYLAISHLRGKAENCLKFRKVLYLAKYFHYVTRNVIRKRAKRTEINYVNICACDDSVKIILELYDKKKLRQVKVCNVYLIAGSCIHLKQKANLFRRVKFVFLYGT